MGSMYAAISGLQASSRWLDVISNNVSNSQTVGFKSARVTFSDLVSQGLSSASAGDAGSNLGGVDPNQLGLGVTVQSIQNIFTQGAIETTGNATDVAITGNGFFTVKSGSQTLYTRAGNFTLDSNGNLVTANGGLVQGWSSTLQRTNDANTTRITAADNVLDTGDVSKIGSITIPSNLELAPQATSADLNVSDKNKGVIFGGNLDEATPANANSALLNTAGLVTGGASQPVAAGASVAANSNPAVAGVTTIAAVNALAGANDPFQTIKPDAVTTNTVYDSVGQPHTITTWFIQVGQTNSTPVANAPQWAWYSFDTTTVSGSAVFTGTPSAANCLGGTGINTSAEYAATDPNLPTSAFGLISFNADGSLQTNGGCDNAANTVQNNPVLMINNELGSASPLGAGTFNPVLGSGAVGNTEFTLNFGTPDTFVVAAASNTNGGFGENIVAGDNGLRDGLTGDYGNGTTSVVGGVSTYTPNDSVTVEKQDGYSEGVLTNIAVDQTGKVNATFSNNQTIAVAQLALASFNNDGGLNSVGSNYYQTSANSGLAVYGTAGSNGFGITTGGALEASNVDLTVELTNMVVAQRMFESNARMVTTADSVMSDLVNLGR
jgi:flagellar hook protein FlgE